MKWFTDTVTGISYTRAYDDNYCVYCGQYKDTCYDVDDETVCADCLDEVLKSYAGC